jgi:methylenetetrahydrofolate reductase (NADPH)
MESGQIDADDVRATARRLMGGFSVEVTPREAGKLADAAAVLAPGTSVYITHLAGVPVERMLTVAHQAYTLGLRPVVHLAVRAVADLGALDRLLGRLVDHGVADLLLIAGSISEPAGSIDNTIQVLESGLLQRRAFATIGVAGHPEGNPGVEPGTVDDALARKGKIAAEFGLPLYLLTQFCFSADPIIGWERRIREAGNALPVHVGLPGLTSPAKLLRYGLSCGIGPSLTVLRKQTGNVFRLATQVYRPADTVAGLARAVAEDPDSLISGLHFFPFGAVVPTAEWAIAIADGRFDVSGDGRLVTDMD